MWIFHFGDTMVLVDPAELPSRLESANFKGVRIEAGQEGSVFVPTTVVRNTAPNHSR